MVDVATLFHIVSNEKNLITIQLSDKNHPIFQAHFPNNHLLPGFCHIDILSQILNDKIKQVNFLKLKRKTFPQDIISYQIDSVQNKRKVKIVNNEEQIVGNLSYEY